ncbi:MAG: hypothetical protein ACHQU8_05910 [Gemmatimonadales bacterium]
MKRRAAGRPSGHRLAVLTSCMLTVACADPVTPPAAGPLADAATVSAGLHIMDGTLATPAMQSLQALAGLMRAAGSPVASNPAPACGASPASPAVRDGPSPAVTALIPDTLRRRVFVYDVVSGAYQETADTSGPVNGIRYMLYSVDTLARVITPLASTGWLDLGELGGTPDSIHAQIRSGPSSVADYLVTLTGTQAADTATLSGTLTDGAHAFVLHDSTAVVGSTQWIAATAIDSIDDVQVRMFAARTSFDPFDYNDTLDFTFVHGADAVRVRGHIQTYCLIPSTGLTVSVDGADFAAVTNGVTSLNVARLDNVPLTPDQTQAILDLKDAQQRLFRGLGAMVTPSRSLLPPN